MMNIAILITCYNRKEKTVKAIAKLNNVFKDYNYNSIFNDKISATIFLTDDNCSDGTPEAAIKASENIPVQIIKADGNAYWAGGMRLAWEKALCQPIDFDFFLLINDDTYLKNNCLEELFKAHKYAIKKYNKAGIYSGFISSEYDENNITYGAKVYTKSVFSKSKTLKPCGQPQECSMVNANILLVSNAVVKSIGILDRKFIHAAADLDYGIRARKAGFPVLTTANVCGYCENDHDSLDVEMNKVLKMSFLERKQFINKPNIKQYHDSSEFFRRYNKPKWLLLKIAYLLNLYLPSLYYLFYKDRSH